MTSDDPHVETTELMCPWCQGPFGITLSMGGSTVHCPHCNGEVTVPSREDLLAMLTPPPIADAVEASPPPPVVAPVAAPPAYPPPPAGLPEVTTEAGPPPPAKPPPPVASTQAEVSPAKVVHVQSREGDIVAFRARGKVIRTEQGEIELRERSRAERSFRQSLRNIVLIILCMIVLLGLPAWLLSRKPKPPPSAPTSEDASQPITPAAP